LARTAPNLRCLFVVLPTFLVLAAGLPSTLHTAVAETSFAVTRFDDPVPDGCALADCSVREAIIAANKNPGPDHIPLSAGTYVLSIPKTSPDSTSGDLDISEDLTITGSGASSTIISGGSGSVGDRVIDVFSPAVVGVSSLTIRDGTVGGVANSGTLALTDVSLLNNTADGASGSGGGTTNAGTLTLTNVTVSGNRSAGRGGGILNEAPGTLSLTNVTVRGNVADSGGGLYNLGAATLNGATVAHNRAYHAGGGVYDLAGALRIANTIIADNTDPSPVDPVHPDCSGGLISQGHNLVENTAGCAGVSGPGDITGLDPKLGTLLDNGGPTSTHAPTTDSPAIDAGNPAPAGSGGGSCTASDQRGTPRALGGRCDIGAVEQVLCLGTQVRRVGTPGNDTLVGTPGPDAILGLSGNDTIDAGSGNDKVCSGDGDDTVNTGSGDDQLQGDQGNDQLRGDSGKDVLTGAEGQDVLVGGPSDDSINGGAGDDILAGGAGNDVLVGDEGNDSLSGETGRDELSGGAGMDALHGGTEDDMLHGGAGADSLFAEDGNDSLGGEQGEDLIDGGAGNDHGDGGSGDDTLFGRDGSDLLKGREGKDRLQGGTGSDDLLGGGQPDRLVGGDDGDRLRGESGSDALIGGRGKDHLHGGAGKDKCLGGPGRDQVKDCEERDGP
jgi:Ca2+-binding RTX toxin-like protein